MQTKHQDWSTTAADTRRDPQSTTPAVAQIRADTIEQVKQHAEIIEVVSEYLALKKSGKEYVGLCPFHDEKTPSFSVSPTKQAYYCHGCSTGDLGGYQQRLWTNLDVLFAFLNSLIRAETRQKTPASAIARVLI